MYQAANGVQLGQGTYASPQIADWPGSQNAWFCAILADEDAWNRVNKAWVPETADDGCTPLWWEVGGKYHLRFPLHCWLESV